MPRFIYPAGDAVAAAQVLLDKVELTSSASSIDFTGLDIVSDGYYFIEAELIEATGVNTSIDLFVNGDTTQANYTSQRIYGQGAAASASQDSYARIGYVNASTRAFLRCTISLTGGYARMICLSDDDTPSIYCYSTVYNTSIANITQLTVRAEVAGTAFAIGSIVRLYKVMS